MEAAYDPTAREHPPAPDDNTAVYAPEGYLAYLTRLRDDALGAGDSASVARLEARIIDHELFLAEVVGWGERRPTRSRG